MATEYTNGPMRVSIRGTGRIIRYLGMANTPGMTAGSTTVTGKIIICTAREYTNGLTVVFLRAITSMTKKKATASTLTQTEGHIEAAGKMANNMDRVLS